MQKPKKVNQLQIGKNMRVELQIPPSPNVDLTTPRLGLELTGIGYEYAGVKKNKYLYNGKELIEDAGLQYYDYGGLFLYSR